MLDNGASPPPGVPGALRKRLLDDTLLVFLSDTHIGGQAGSEIFQSAAELTALLQDLNHHQGPVELVLAGDFLDLLRMGDPGRIEERVTATMARPDYQDLFTALRTFTHTPARRVVYLAGNHDAETGRRLPEMCGDRAAQARQAFRRLEASLGRFDASLGSVLRLDVFLRDIYFEDEFLKIAREALGPDGPTMNIIGGDLQANAEVELSAIAGAADAGSSQ